MTSPNKPLILVCNDDSVYAKGIKELVEVASEFGEIVVVAPDKPQSAKSHSVTLEHPIFFKPTDNFGGHTAYKCSGTPADCVKLAIHQILKRKPDFIISGINHGSNSSVNVLYSGTLAATIEGCMHTIPSIGFSLLSFESDADFNPAKPFIRKILHHVVTNSLPPGTCLNVNIPNIEAEKFKGIKVCRQTKGVWAEEFNESKHPSGRFNYYWLTGKYINLEPDATDTDIWALENDYVAVVPIQIDLTDYKNFQKLTILEQNN